MAEVCIELEENRIESGDGKAEEEKGGLPRDGSIHGFESLHRLLSSSLKPEIFKVSFFFFLVWFCFSPSVPI